MDLSDLVEHVAWLQQHDARARQIAEAGVALARRLLAPPAVDAYLGALVRGVASMQSAPPPRDDEEQGGDVYVPVTKAGASERKFYSSHGLIDQKERPVDVHCPAHTAPSWMVNITSAAALVQAYYDAARVEPPRKRPSKKRPAKRKA